MKILITGANGFIGSYLASYFLQKGHEVIASSRRFNASTQTLLSKATQLELDVLDKEGLHKLTVSADVIIHTATANDIISKDTLKGIELSAVGTKNILDLAVKNNIPKVMVFSTLQVYGTDLMGDIDENSTLHYQNDYGLNHLFGEMYAELYSRQAKLNTVSVRPSNVYGRILTDSFNRWSLVPGCFCKEAIESGIITIKSSGLQMRNFVNLQNLSRAVDSILQHFPDNYECYNLASSQPNTMVETAEKVKTVYEKLFQKPVQLNVTGTEPKETNHFKVSLKKLEALGFTEDENYTMETEIAQIFNYLTSK
ncbi:MAG TPA: NAD(P)-dependent oxidoreductase [Ferruginibacter sp.]|nr:NAD(P)-dependent oxidoreductase [Ferruginibacter sp.]